MIYFVEHPEGRIKIGTTIRLSVRLARLEVECGRKLKILAVTEGSFVEEKKLHKTFDRWRVEGEWFMPCEELTFWIKEHADEWDGKDECGYIKLHEDVVKLARVVAAYERVSVTDLLSDILEPVLEKRERDGRAKRNALDAKKGKVNP